MRGLTLLSPFPPLFSPRPRFPLRSLYRRLHARRNVVHVQPPPPPANSVELTQTDIDLVFKVRLSSLYISPYLGPYLATI